MRAIKLERLWEAAMRAIKLERSNDRSYRSRGPGITFDAFNY